MASLSMSLACVLILYFSPLGNRYLFWGGLEPYIQPAIAHEVDKTPLQAPYGNKSIPGYPIFPSLFCCPSLVSLPGHYLTPLCPHLVSQEQKTLSHRTPTLPSFHMLKPLHRVPLATSWHGGLLRSTAKLKCPLLHKASPESLRLGQQSLDQSPQNRH